MAWCTHCRKACRKECINGFIACPTCGKILGEVGVRKTRMKRVKKKKKAAGTIGPDFSCGSSGAVIHQGCCSTCGEEFGQVIEEEELESRGNQATVPTECGYCAV